MDKSILFGYIFTVINYGLYCVSRFCKNKKQMIVIDLTSKVACIIGLYLLGSLTGSYGFLANFAWLFFIYAKEKTGKKFTLAFVFFQLLLVYIAYITYAGLSSICIFISLSITLIGTWWWTPQLMRSTGLIVNISTLIYQYSIANWAGLICELMVIVSNVASYLKYRKTEG